MRKAFNERVRKIEDKGFLHGVVISLTSVPLYLAS
jgi:hypothetical protein